MISRIKLTFSTLVILFLVLFIICSSILLFSDYFAISINQSKKTIVVFRNDDLQESFTSGVDIELFDLFKDNNIPQSYAIVPFKYDLNKKPELIKSLKKYLTFDISEIVQHGYSHENIGLKKIKQQF